MSVSKQIRSAAEAAKKAGASESSIAKAAGVTQPTFFRFLKGEAVRSEVIDRLAAYFDMELQPAARKSAATLPKTRKKK